MGSTVIAAMLTFTSYVNFYHVGLDPARIFTASILVNMLRWPLMQIPEAISAYARTKISVGRVQSFIMGEEQEKRKEGGASMEEGVAISIKNGYFSWGCKKAKVGDCFEGEGGAVREWKMLAGGGRGEWEGEEEKGWKGKGGGQGGGGGQQVSDDIPAPFNTFLPHSPSPRLLLLAFLILVLPYPPASPSLPPSSRSSQTLGEG